MIHGNCESLLNQSGYHNDPKFSDRQVLANRVGQDQGLHYLPFHLHLLEALLYGKNKFFKF